MSLPQTLLRIRSLREHRSLVALQVVRLTREAEEAAQQHAHSVAQVLAQRQQRLRASECEGRRIAEPGATGLQFEQFVAHARASRMQVRAQRVEVDAAQAAVHEAGERLAQARGAHAAARKAEDKLTHFRGTVMHNLRAAAEAVESDILEEVSLTRRRPPAPAPPASGPSAWEAAP